MNFFKSSSSPPKRSGGGGKCSCTGASEFVCCVCLAPYKFRHWAMEEQDWTGKRLTCPVHARESAHVCPGEKL